MGQQSENQIIFRFPRSKAKKQRLVALIPCPACDKQGVVFLAKNETYSFHCREGCKGATIFGHYMVVRLILKAYELDPERIYWCGVDELNFLKEAQIVLEGTLPPSFHTPYFNPNWQEKS